jgi:hypothetical protein
MARAVHPGPRVRAGNLADELLWLFLLPLAIGCVSWTITHEEIFREPRDYCQQRSRTCRTLLARKLFYIPTCEYCFSHYVTAGFLLLTGYRVLLDDWRGVVLAFFIMVAIANTYMSAFGRLRVDIRSERLQVKLTERQLDDGEAPGGSDRNGPA